MYRVGGEGHFSTRDFYFRPGGEVANQKGLSLPKGFDDWATDLAWSLIWCGSANDRFRVREQPLHEWIEEWNSYPMESLPSFVAVDDINTEADFIPYLWDDAMEIESKKYHSSNQLHPSITSVNQVQKKSFAMHVCNKIGMDGIGSWSGNPNTDAPSHYLAKWDATQNQYIMNCRCICKPDHSLAGYGHQYIEPNMPWPKKLIGTWVIEPCLNRLADFGTIAHIPKSGNPSTLYTHRLLCSTWGRFIGIEIPVPHAYTSWIESIHGAVLNSIKSIQEEGFFGPCGWDSFVYIDDNQNQVLRPIVEFNPRLTMAAAAWAIYERLGKKGSLRWRTYRSSSLPPPANRQEWLHWKENTEKQFSGIQLFLVSPPSYQSGRKAHFWNVLFWFSGDAYPEEQLFEKIDQYFFKNRQPKQV